MIRKIIIFFVLLFGCASYVNDDWDSGARRRTDYQQQRMEETSENVQNQFPTTTPGTERNQPF
jgi:hypothetical protein